MSISFVNPALKPPQTAASMAATDGELLMRFQRHDDEEAFAEVVERHGRLVWLVCQQVLRNRADVEDAFQATFLVLAQKANTIHASKSAAAWLYKVAYRTAIAARRRRSSRREESLASEPPQGEAALPLLGDRHMHSVLMEELRGLPTSYQAVLVMRYLEGQSRRSIAAQTDSTVGQVQGRLARGRRLLRSRMVRRGVSLSLAMAGFSGAALSASAAVTPTIAATTAAVCLSVKIAGTATALSPTVQQLVQEGIKAMWCTSMMKTTLVATSIVALSVVTLTVPVAVGGDSSPGVPVAEAEGVELQADAKSSEALAPVKVETSNASVESQSSNTLGVAFPVVEPRSVFVHKKIEGLRSVLQAKLQQRAMDQAKSEREQLGTSLLQREVEKLHEMSIALRHPEKLQGELEETRALRENRLEQIRKELATAQDQLAQRIAESAAASAQIESQRLELDLIEQQLKQLNVLKTNLEVGAALEAASNSPIIHVREQTANDEAPLVAYGQQSNPFGDSANITFQGTTTAARDFQAVDQHEVVTRQLEELNAEVAKLRKENAALEPGDRESDDSIHPGDVIRIHVINAFAGNPINDAYPVEKMGTIALGPSYGRVEVKGMSVLEAEDAVKRHLAKIIEDPQVQVTLIEKQSTVQDLEVLYSTMEKLRAENVELKNQLKQPPESHSNRRQDASVLSSRDSKPGDE